MNEDMKQLIEKYPFLTGIKYADNEIIGIVQNHNAHITSIYSYDLINDEDLKKKFLAIILERRETVSFPVVSLKALF